MIREENNSIYNIKYKNIINSEDYKFFELYIDSLLK